MNQSRNSLKDFVKIFTCTHKKKSSKNIEPHVLVSYVICLLTSSSLIILSTQLVAFKEGILSGKRAKIMQEDKPSVIYVNERSQSISPNGNSWGSAYPSLTEAFENKMTGKKEIWVAKGTYYINRNAVYKMGFIPILGIKLYGGFIGNETSREQRNWKVNRTVLTGMKGNNNGISHNIYNVAFGAGILSVTMPDVSSPDIPAVPEIGISVQRAQCEMIPYL